MRRAKLTNSRCNTVSAGQRVAHVPVLIEHTWLD